MTDRELMQMALDALEGIPIEYDFHGNPMDEDAKKIKPAIEALRDRLAQPEREWVGLAADETENITSGSVTLLKVALETEAKLKEKNNG